jgi:hypothetical protein
MKPDFKFKIRKRKKLTSLLSLALDGSKLDGVVLKRTNGALAVLQKFSVTLALDPLTAAPELVGREIRNQLDAAGVRERDCIVGVPLKWVLTAHTELPQLPEADAQSLLQMEAERGFHSDLETLLICDSRSALAGGKTNVLLAAIPNTHLAALENVLAAAKLRPVSFAPGISALQFPGDEKSGGVLALAVGERNVTLQITAGGGVVALRSLEGAADDEAGRHTLHTEVVARETRITLGQLPAELRAAVKRIRVFGSRELAQRLVDELELRFEPMGLKVELVSAYAPDEFGLTLPVEAGQSPAFSLAARFLAEQRLPFEFLPPKPTLVEQFVAKYSSGRLRTTGAVAAGVVFIILGIFLFQEYQLWRWNKQWSDIKVKVGQLQAIRDNIRDYRSWYDGTYPTLAILRQLSLAFPENGSVTAKNIEVRDGSAVTCSGTASDYASLLTMQSELRKAAGVSGVALQSIRGKMPMQFVLEFKYNNNGGAQ